MDSNKKFYFAIFFTSFLITWLLYIYWLDKDDFDYEFREKLKTTGIIIDVYSEAIEHEFNDHRQVKQNIVNYIDYSYVVDKIKYINNDKVYNTKYSALSQVEVEYVKCNPSNSKVVGSSKYSYNFFIRNIIPVLIISIFGVFGILLILDFFTKSNRVNDLLDFIKTP